jgi:hypothetical protein
VGYEGTWSAGAVPCCTVLGPPPAPGPPQDQTHKHRLCQSREIRCVCHPKPPHP